MRLPLFPLELRASVTEISDTQLVLEASRPTVQLESDALPKFEILAYTGRPMKFPNVKYPVVVDLTGRIDHKDPTPSFRDHDPKQRIGHGSISVNASGIHVRGVMSGAGDAAREVLAELKAGFPYQASIGAIAHKGRLIPRGRSVYVNGRDIDGPVIVASHVTIREVSWASIGRDDNTTGKLAASIGGHTMDFEKWLESLGLDAADLDDKKRDALETTYKIEIGELKAAKVGAGAGSGGGDLPDLDELRREAQEIVKNARLEASEDRKRIAAIRDLCGDENAEIAGKAIEAGWDENRTELELLRNGRESGTFQARRSQRGSGNERGLNLRVLEAATLQSLGWDDKQLEDASFDEKTLEAAESYHGLGLKDLALICMRNDRDDAPNVFGGGDEVIEAATSTRSLSSVASNVLDKIALETYRNQEVTACEIARTRPVRDFKSVKRYRMVGTGKWESVGKDGTLKSGKIDDAEYSNQAKTYGQYIGISREDFINDDLGILQDVGQQFSMSGISLIDELTYTELLANTSSFFSAGKSNLITGAEHALGLAGLAKAREAFRKLKAGPGSKGADKRPIQVSPRILLVPPELETDAEVLMNSTGVNLTGSTNSEKPDSNPWRNKYKLVVAPHLSDSSITGSSATAWYLFADPRIVAALELVFLNGRRTPTIRRVNGTVEQLGMWWQGYFDLGVAFQDPKGAQKVTGVDP